MYEHHSCMNIINFNIADLLQWCPWQPVIQHYSDKLGMINGDSVDSGCSEHVLIGARGKKLSAYN